ncbi:hypothetical protein LB503_006296 [Fusarium chuoi]|nr:hypothetical protein LB503_006296 [Fusarium chuoi]
MPGVYQHRRQYGGGGTRGWLPTFELLAVLSARSSMLPCSRSPSYAWGGGGPGGAIPIGSGYKGYLGSGYRGPWLGGPDVVGGGHGGHRRPMRHLANMTIKPTKAMTPIVQEMMQMMDIPAGSSLNWLG